MPTEQETSVPNTDIQQTNAQAEINQLKDELANLKSQSNAAESSLIQNEKMASLGILTAGIAHEINNPVGYIISNVTTLGEYIPEVQRLLHDLRALTTEIPANSPLASRRDEISAQAGEQDIDYILEDTSSLLEETLEGARRVLSIVRGLKDYAHADADELELGNLCDCIKSTLNLVNNELKYNCHIETALNELPNSYFNNGKIGQVFLNLLVNAGHAVGEQGLISVRASQHDDTALIEVTDNGCGIESAALKKIFEPFFTTKEKGKGTGLGLSISRGIVEEHGGEIEVMSKVSQGTTFKITLPLITENPKQEAP